MAKEKLNWQSLDTSAFQGTIKAAWDEYVTARKPITAEIEKLEAKLTPHLDKLESAVETQLRAQGLIGTDKSVQFAYRFGGMGFAETAMATGGKGKVVLGAPVAPAPRRSRSA